VDNNAALGIEDDPSRSKGRRKKTTQEFEDKHRMLEDSSERSIEDGEDSSSEAYNKRITNRSHIQWEEDDEEILMIEERNHKRYKPFVIPTAEITDSAAIAYPDSSSRDHRPPPMLTNSTTRGSVYAITAAGGRTRVMNPIHQADGFTSIMDADQNGLFPTLADLNLEQSSGTKLRKANRRYVQYQDQPPDQRKDI
jgi:hypothetical protein